MLMATYGWSEKHIRTGISSAKGWVWYAWAMQNRLTMFGVMYELKTPGYIQQEAAKILSKKNG